MIFIFHKSFDLALTFLWRQKTVALRQCSAHSRYPCQCCCCPQVRVHSPRVTEIVTVTNRCLFYEDLAKNGERFTQLQVINKEERTREMFLCNPQLSHSYPAQMMFSPSLQSQCTKRNMHVRKTLTATDRWQGCAMHGCVYDKEGDRQSI